MEKASYGIPYRRWNYKIGLPNVQPQELFNNMNQNRIYQPTVNDIIEAHRETSVISNIKQDSKHSIQQK